MGVLQELESVIKSLNAIAELLENGVMDAKTASESIKKTVEKITV